MKRGSLLTPLRPRGPTAGEKDPLLVCIEAVLAGGDAIVRAGVGLTAMKADPHVGHHAIITAADLRSHRAIRKILLAGYPRAHHITEEGVGIRGVHNGGLPPSALAKLAEDSAFIVDELDGTSSFAVGHYEWSVSVGFVERLSHQAGAICAPRILGGSLFYAKRGHGAFLRLGRYRPRRIKVRDTLRLRDAYVLLGPDALLRKYPIHRLVLPGLADASRTINISGSCALGLGLVAAGKVDALVQPPQSPWDWAAGKVIVEEAGGKLFFYELRDGRVHPVAKPHWRHYDPLRRALGFVAASPRLGRRIMALMCAPPTKMRDLG